MIRVAVAPSKFARGVEAPGYKGKTYDWRAVPLISPENTAGVVAGYDVRELDEALVEEYASDAHLVSYLVRDRQGIPLARQPRVNKPALAWLALQGFMTSHALLVADADNAGHAAWTSPAAATAEADRVAALVGTAGVYVTTHGLRIVQPLARAVGVDLIEPTIRAWLASLEQRGIQPDWQCADWTRHMRCPNVRRQGRPYRSPRINLDVMVPIEPPAAVAFAEPTSKPKRPRRAPRAVVFAPVVAAGWVGLVGELAVRIRSAGFAGERHEVFLALAGALLARRIPAEEVPSIVEAVAVQAGADAAHHRRSAEDTTRRWAGGYAVKGARALPPELADIIDVATLKGRAKVAAQAAAVESARPLAEVLVELEDAFRSPGDGLSVIKAQCGLGKTRAASKIAAERAAKTHASPGPHARAPLGSKTAIAVPTHALAAQVASNLRAAGVRVLRVFGPLSVKGADGQPVCAYAGAAAELARGGQSVPWELCEGRRKSPCEHRSTCPAYAGAEGPEDARVAVGPHDLAAQLDAFAGSTGLLVLDEPPSLLETVAIDDAQLDEAELNLPRFEGRYGAAMAPAVRAVRLWLREHGPVDEPGPLDRAFALGVDGDLMAEAFIITGAKDAHAAVKNAFEPRAEDEEARIPAPPLRPSEVAKARTWVEHATRLGQASRVLRALYAAFLLPSSARIELRGAGLAAKRVLVLTWPREPLGRVVRRAGSVVIAGADADVHVPVYQRVAGYEPRVRRFAAPDGAPVARTLLRMRATRKAWLVEGRVDVAAVERALCAVVAWCEEAAFERVALVTFKAIAELLRSAGAGARVPSTLSSILAPLSHLDVGHYGALRGLDHWKGHDVLITLGDPWPALGEVQHEADFLSIPWEERAEALCRAELEQAHGRLRTVHRTVPARALHVGHVLPGGWGDRVDVREDHGGRPANEGDVSAEQLKAAVAMLGGVSAAAKTWGMHRATIYRLLGGEHAADDATARAVKVLLASRRAPVITAAS